jgi:hypothetical protein
MKINNERQVFRGSRVGKRRNRPETQFIVPNWRDKVDYGIGLSYRKVRLHRLAGRYDNPMPLSTLFPIKGL